ncbi:MAG: hypothetical protein K6G65_01360 [Lachnospiraceae bacterium]|nr:hypothetical protein [Lachnospiraceae bacterium]
MWCPKCKIEYTAGITVCADCKSKLVEELSDEVEVIYTTNSQSEAGEILDFLHYSDISSAEISYNEETNEFDLVTTLDDAQKAGQMLQLFLAGKNNHPAITGNKTDEEGILNEDISFEENEEISSNTQEEEEDSLSSNTSVYVKSQVYYDDLKSSAQAFTAVGVLGIVFWVLNFTGIIPWFQQPFVLAVMMIMFLAFIGVGISSFLKLKSAKEDMEDEGALSQKVQDWLRENITEETLLSLNEEGDTPEVSCMRHYDYIKEKLSFEMSELDEAYMDAMIEDFYNSLHL